MGAAKSIEIKFISSKDARKLITNHHYSKKFVNNSQLHFGVFYNGKAEGALQFGPPMDKSKVIGLVKGTKWNDFIELNRMAFSSILPKNSESRALAICFKIIKKLYPHIKWILSFADATQSGDGAIYRASGFKLTAIRKNETIVRLADGSITNSMTLTSGAAILQTKGKAAVPKDTKPLTGFQLRYIKLLSTDAILTVPEIPFSKIDEMGARMYKGNLIK